jgi:cytochrome P450
MLAGNRIFADAAEVLGRPVGPDARLTPCIYLAHHRPDSYPNPHRFDPERFLGHRMPAQEYLPFGGGIRRCLGADLAMLELRMVTAAVLRAVELRCVNPERGVPHVRGPAMGPGADLRMAVRACHG